ncbi:acyl-CoA dehydrogenase family protein [Streptomyces sp. NPDC004296]|uniref:acyl-CoA dehydrogenase family protein n=1 Tax=Streptomyces sp. NPDC004296 TaxID=3364697 RepID=UPI0036994C0E
MSDTAAQRTRQLWAELGGATLRDVFAKPDPRYGYDPHHLRNLLADVDARAALGSTLSVCVQVANALPLLLAAWRGSAHRLTTVAEDILDGTAQIAVAATDGTAPGSDLTSLGTTVEFSGDRVELTGTKHWIVNAMTAEWALVLARHAPGRQFTSFTLLLVPLDTPGVTRSPADTTAFNGSALGGLTFDRVQLGTGHVIGGRGRGLALFARQMAGERLASGLWAEALASRVLAEVRTHLSERRIAGAPLWHNAAVRQRYAEAVLTHQTLRALCDRLSQPRPDNAGGLEEAMALTAVVKAAGARTLDTVLDTCGPLMGADGFKSDGIQQLRLETAMFGIAGGTTATLLDLIADHSEALVPAVATAGAR